MKWKIALLIAHLAANGADAYFTQQAMSRKFHSELDPLARPFVTHGTALLVIGFSSGTAAEMMVPRILRNHPIMSATLDLAGTVGHTWGAITSASIQPERKIRGIPIQSTPLRGYSLPD